MKKKCIGYKVVSLLVSLLMALSFSIPTCGVLEVKAAEKPFNPYEKQMFKDLINGGCFSCSEVSGVESTSDGVLFTQDCKKSIRLDLVEDIDFGDTGANWIELNAIAEAKTEAKVSFTIGNAIVADYVIPNQNKAKDWSKNKDIYIPLPSVITGEQSFGIKIDITDPMTNQGDKQVMLKSIKFHEGTIPLVSFNIDERFGTIMDMNNDPKHQQNCYGSMRIVNDTETMQEYNCDSIYELSLDYIRGRGNSTWDARKKPYKIKLDEKADLYGFGSNKDWTLLANYYDDSLVRNRMTYQIGKDLGMEFTPDSISVDVIMNGEYIGNYLLAEKVELDEGRVDIPSLEKSSEGSSTTSSSSGGGAPDVSGGYLLSMWPYGDEKEYAFFTKNYQQYLIESPASDYPNTVYERAELGDKFVDDSKYKAANEYMQNYMNDLEDAIYSPTFKNSKGQSYEDLLDIDSAIKYFWVQEFSKNGDAFWTSSTYLYKKPDSAGEKGKLYFGPLWDFDYVAWASTDYVNYDDTTVYKDWSVQSEYFQKLLEDPKFVTKVKDYWYSDMKTEMIHVIENGGLLDKYYSQLKESADCNFAKWGYAAYNSKGPDAGYENPNPVLNNSNGLFNYGNYDYEIERLKTYIEKRIEWIDENIDTIDKMNVSIRVMDGTKVLDSYKGKFDTFLETLPEMPNVRDGKAFEGWFYKYEYYEDGELISDEEEVTEDTRVSRDMVNDNNEFIIYAKWADLKDIVPISNIHFDKTDYYLYYINHGDWYEGGSVNIPYTILPSDASITNIKLKSSNANCVSVSNDGTAFACAPGDALVYAINEAGKKFSVNVHVIDVTKEYNANPDGWYEKYQRENITLSSTSITLKEGETACLTYSDTPKITLFTDIADYVVDWYSLDNDVAIVNNGVIEAVGVGKTRIILFDKYNNEMKYCVVNVEAEPDEPDPKEAKTFTLKNIKYKIVSNTKKSKTVMVTGLSKNIKKVTIPATVKYNKATFKVTAINKNAFAKNKKIQEVVIGKNVKKIGSKAFYNCSKLKKITIKSTLLTNKNVGAKAFAGINKKAKIKVPKKKLKVYTKFLKKKGISKTVKVTK